MAREQEPLASIDDLLGGPVVDEAETVLVERPVRHSAAGAAVTWLLWSLLFAGMLSGAVFVVAYAFGYTLPYPLLFCAFFALVVLRRSLTALAGPQVVVGAAPKIRTSNRRRTACSWP
jgi:hypothetical protein